MLIVTPELILIPPAADRVRRLPVAQVRLLATTMLPVSLPLEPVLTVTLPPASALSRVATVRIDPLPEGVQTPAEQLSTGVPAVVWMMTS